MVIASIEHCPVCGKVHSLPDARSFDREEMGCDLRESFRHADEMERARRRGYAEEMLRAAPNWDLHRVLDNWQLASFGATRRSGFDLDNVNRAE